VCLTTKHTTVDRSLHSKAQPQRPPSKARPRGALQKTKVPAEHGSVPALAVDDDRPHRPAQDTRTRRMVGIEPEEPDDIDKLHNTGVLDVANRGGSGCCAADLKRSVETSPDYDADCRPRKSRRI
jgi:hypothetical protein